MIGITLLFFVSLLFGQLGAISPMPGVYIYIHDGVLALMVLSYVLPHRNSKFKIQNSKLFWPIVAFIGASLLSVIANVNRLEQATTIRSLLYMARWSFYATLYFIVASSKRPTFWLKGLYLTGVGFAIIGIAQFILYPSLRNLLYLGWDPHYYRVFSTLLDPNYSGIILVLTLFLYPVVRRLYKQTRMVDVCTGIVSVAFILTFSRSSILALLAGLAVWVIKSKKWHIIGIAVLLLVAYIVIPKPGGDTLRLLRPESTMARIGNWQESIRLISASPVIGHGFYALPRPVDATVSRSTAYLDSSLLFVFAASGIIGFASYLWLMLRIVSVIGSAREKELKSFWLVGHMSLVGLFVHSIFVNSLFYAWVMIWVWVLVGVAQSISDR